MDYLPYRVWRSKNPVLAAVMQIFIDFHQGASEDHMARASSAITVWPLLKSAADLQP